MPTRDANNTTFYVLRYREDFTPRAASAEDPTPPTLDGNLFYDESRGVLELCPSADTEAAEPPPSLAVDPAGDIYLPPVGGVGPLRRRRCDGSEVPLPCEPHVLARPAGLALDRRGLLYVADPAARRVVVLSTEDGSVRAVLSGQGLKEPVDVAVAPNGRVYVADREAGLVHIYRSSFQRLSAFAARGPAGTPAAPRPIAVAIDGDGAVLVADAHYPRLLRFSATGAPLSEQMLVGTDPLPAGDLAFAAFETFYGKRLPRSRAGVCGPCAPDDDLGKRLASMHLTLRMMALRLSHSFPESGVFVSAALDGGRPGIPWHKLELEADLPAGTSLTIETTSADRRELFNPATATWYAPSGDTGKPVPFAADGLDQLILAPPGRWLWVRVTLYSQGESTPSMQALRVYYPRRSYLDDLPRVYRSEPQMAAFLEHYLSLFERVLTGVEDRYEEFSRELNAAAAPREVIDWLACLVDLAFDPSWPLERRRALVLAAMELYRTRGTVRGLARYIEIYTGKQPVIREDFLQRPSAPTFLGQAGHLLGGQFALRAPEQASPPDSVLRRMHAHRFSVLVFVDDECERDATLAVVERIVQVNKPAHTIHVLRTALPGARVGLLELGVDFVVGAAETTQLALAGCPAPGPASAAGTTGPKPGAILGRDSVLVDRRPPFLSPLARVL